MSQSTEPISPSAEQVQAALTAALEWLKPISVVLSDERLMELKANILTHARKGEVIGDVLIRVLHAENARLTAALAEKDAQLIDTVKRCDAIHDELKKDLNAKDGLEFSELWCQYNEIKTQLASQQEALSAAADALFPLAHVATFAERHKDATGIWNHSDTHGPSFVLTVGHCRDAQKALARVNACLPEETI